MSKKIIILNHGLHICGVSQALIVLANELVRQGHDVTIKIEISDFTLAFLLDKRVKVSLFLDEQKLSNKRIKGFLRYYECWRKNLLKLPALKQYKKVVKEQYDVEIAFNRGASAKIIAASNNDKAIKLVWVHNDYMLCGNALAGFQTLDEAKEAYKKFQKIICVSKHAQSSFEELFSITNNVVVKHNPVDENQIRLLAKEEINLDLKFGIPIVVTVGRLSVQKGFDFLIKVHKKLIDENMKHYLIIVGDGPERSALEKQIDDFGLKGTVILTGAQTNPYKFIKAARFTVCSSLYEGFHIASKESIILGKPVISRCDVVEEIFGEYECGIIANSFEEFYHAMYKMLSDNTLYEYYVRQTILRSQQLKLSTTIKDVTSLFDEVPSQN